MSVDQQSETVPVPSTTPDSPPMEQAAAVALAYLRATRRTGSTVPLRVLAEIAEQIRTRSQKGQDTSLTALSIKSGVAPDASKEPSGWMSPIWAKLIQSESQWQEGLVDQARQSGLAFIPKLVKQPGSPAHYTFEAIPLGAKSETQLPDVPPGGLRYTPEVVAAPAGWLSSTLRNGVVRWTVGLRWTLLGTVVFATLLALFSIWSVYTVGLRRTTPLSLADVLTVAGVVGLAGILVPVYRFLDELFDLRIAIAPSGLTPWSVDDATLEIRSSRHVGDPGELAFVRYTAICPACDALVTVTSGRREFPDRLVGRCRRSGREHIYTFDHVLRIGHPLR